MSTQLPPDIEQALQNWGQAVAVYSAMLNKTHGEKCDETFLALRALLAPLCADKARLDWMQENLSGRSTPLKHDYHYDDSEAWYVQTAYDLRGPTFTEGPTLRAAIDAAREVPA